MPISDLSRKNTLARVTLGSGILVSLAFGLQVKHVIDHDATNEFRFNCDQVTLRIHERLEAYALLLRGGAALFAASTNVERDEWRAYAAALLASGRVPGIQGMGFAQAIAPDQLASHVARIRSEGFPDYSVRPPGARALYTAIVYLEPFRDRNLRAFGFDMFSEPVRRAAMEHARDSGHAALSGKVTLVQETATDVQAGALMYVPVYRNGAPMDTVARRQAALIGWTYSPYRMNDLMTAILHDWVSRDGKGVDLIIYDGRTATPADLLFDSNPDVTPDAHTPFHEQRSLDFNGRPWLLVFNRTGSDAVIGYAPAWGALTGGLALSALLFGLMRAVINTRSNAVLIADELTDEIRRREALLRQSEAFDLAILNSVPAEIAVVDRAGVILAVNDAWRQFALDNGTEPGTPAPRTDVGSDYLAVCGTAADTGTDSDAVEADAGIRAVLDGSSPTLRLEYPCDSPQQQRWFAMTVTPLGRDASTGVVITHTDITLRKQAEAALRRSETKFRTLYDATSDAVMLLDETGFLDCNKATMTLFGCATRDEFCSYHPADLSPLQQPGGLDSATLARRHIASAVENGSCRFEWTHKRVDSSTTFIAEVLLSAIALEGHPTLLASVHDITERKQVEEKLQLSASVFTHAWEGIMITDADGTILDVNDAFTRITSYHRDEVLGRNARLLSSGRQDQSFYAAMWRALIEQRQWSGEVWNRRKNGEAYAVMQTISAVRDAQGTTRQYVALFSDITLLKEHERELEQIINHDALTRLPNRLLLADRLRQGMALAQRHGRLLALAFLDLDGFKTINDRHGHAAGDQVLIAVAAAMQQVLREGDTLARFGGDEFVAVLLDLTDTQAGVLLLARLLRAVAEAVPFGEHLLQVSASVGVTFYPQAQPIAADQLLRQADEAMYQAKLAGKNRYQVFDAGFDRGDRGHREGQEHRQTAPVSANPP